jgi:DNA-binding NtrC family response regulator
VNKRVLVIDDESSMAEIVRLNLELVGDYEVETAVSGEEGLRKMEDAHFDLLVTDFMLPGITGGDVVRRVKSQRPDMPVVLFSIYYDDVTTIPPEVCRSADACLRKPLDHDEFVRVVAGLLGDGPLADAPWPGS